jgi:hypothetical protein
LIRFLQFLRTQGFDFFCRPKDSIFLQTQGFDFLLTKGWILRLWKGWRGFPIPPKKNAHEKSVRKPGRRLRAQELATKAIDKMIDPSAPPEERAQRQLTKGPEEFREVRVDRPKVKGRWRINQASRWLV